MKNINREKKQKNIDHLSPTQIKGEFLKNVRNSEYDNKMDKKSNEKLQLKTIMSQPEIIKEPSEDKIQEIYSEISGDNEFIIGNDLQRSQMKEQKEFIYNQSEQLEEEEVVDQEPPK